MASCVMPKLSLVAQYDDLCRQTKTLTETSLLYKEFKKYVETQKSIYEKRKDFSEENRELREKVKSLQYDIKSLETKLNHMKKVVVSEVEKRKEAENENSNMKMQIQLIKDVLLSKGNTIDNETKEKFFQLNSASKHQVGSPYRLTTIEESVGSLLSSSDCDQSDTETDNGITHRKRRSRGKKKSSGEYCLKKRKSEERNRFCFDDLKLDEESTIPKKVDIFNIRSNSEPQSSSPERIVPRPILRSDSEQIKRAQKYNTLGYNGNTPVSYFNVGKLSNRTHDFATKTVIKPEKCYPCGKSIKCFQQVLKCINCRVVSHPECKDKCPGYCIPASATPTRGLTGVLSDYTSSTPPMIPPLLMYCVNQIESKGLNTVGLYRESASKIEVKNLLDKFLKGKSVPSLNEVDVHTLCGTIKSFLRSLKETLITRTAWKTFVDAASCANEDQSMNRIFSAVCDLPQPNRDTLAFLVLHFQKIAASPDCKMPIENLAKVLGPTIVGYSTSESSESNFLPEAITETKLQYKVMEKLLIIPDESWQSLLNEENNPYQKQMKTPECTPAPITSRLGPIVSSDQKSSRSTTPIRRTPTSRVTRTKMGRQFFSPLLK